MMSERVMSGNSRIDALSEADMKLILHGRLDNWKFGQATAYLGDSYEEEAALVRALAQVFGNPGGFDGDLGTIVRAAVTSIIGEDG